MCLYLYICVYLEVSWYIVFYPCPSVIWICVFPYLFDWLAISISIACNICSSLLLYTYLCVVHWYLHGWVRQVAAGCDYSTLSPTYTLPWDLLPCVICISRCQRTTPASMRIMHRVETQLSNLFMWRRQLDLLNVMRSSPFPTTSTPQHAPRLFASILRAFSDISNSKTGKFWEFAVAVKCATLVHTLH